MSSFAVPPAAVPAEIPRPVPLHIVSPSAEPPDGKGWLHKAKHDAHRLLAMVAGDHLKLISRNGHDRTALFREPFRGLTGPDMVLDGESAVPDDRGVTHIDVLTEAMRHKIIAARSLLSDQLTDSSTPSLIHPRSVTSEIADPRDQLGTHRDEAGAGRRASAQPVETLPQSRPSRPNFTSLADGSLETV